MFVNFWYCFTCICIKCTTSESYPKAYHSHIYCTRWWSTTIMLDKDSKLAGVLVVLDSS